MPGGTPSAGKKPAPEWLLRAINQAVDAVFVTDTDDRLCYVNRAVLALTGIPRNKLIGESILTIVAPKDHGSVLDALETARESKGAGPQLLEMTWTSDSLPEPVRVEVTIQAVRAKGEVLGCIGVARDLLGRQEYTAERLASERAAAVHDLAKSAAHKINNPLAILITHLGVIERAAHEGQPAPAESVQNMRQVIERIAEATQELSAAADTSIQKAMLGGVAPGLGAWTAPSDEGEDSEK